MEYSHIEKKELSGFYCLTWSFRQGAFHVGTLLDCLEHGLEAYRKNRNTQDYILLDISTSDRLLKKMEEARRMILAELSDRERKKKKPDWTRIGVWVAIGSLVAVVLIYLSSAEAPPP